MTSFSKSSAPRFDRLDGLKIIKEKILEGQWRTPEFKPCPITDFLISSSRPLERHTVYTVRVNLFVIYGRFLCDLPPMSGHSLAGRSFCGRGETFELVIISQTFLQI